MTKGRASVIVDKKELQDQLSKAESEKTFTGVMQLCEHVAATDWAKNHKNTAGRDVKLEAATIYNRIQKFGMTIQTKLGKRGRQAGVKVEGVIRRSRAEKAIGNPLLVILTKNCKAIIPERQQLIDKAAAGNFAAAINAHCFDCVGGAVALIGTDNCSQCPLMFIRAFKGNMTAFKKEVS
jgi:hypothetical protein